MAQLPSGGVIPNGWYSIQNVNSNMNFDVAGNHLNKPGVRIQQWKPNVTVSQSFYLQKVNDTWYSIKNEGSGLYLDIESASTLDHGKLQQWSGNGSNAQQFKFIETSVKSNEYYIQVRCSNMNLDVPNASTKSGVKLQQITPNGSAAQKFRMIPSKYTLKAAITDFDYGDAKEVEKIIEKSKEVAFIDTSKVTVNEVGITINGEYGEEVKESFSYGFSETVGVGVETEATAGVPGVLSVSGKVTASFEFGSNQQWTAEDKKNFRKSYNFKPETTGIYEVGMTVKVAKNVELPFNAVVTMTGFSDDDNKTVFSGEKTAYILKYTQFNCPVDKIQDKSVKAKISGNMKATFAVSSDVWNKKISDI